MRPKRFWEQLQLNKLRYLRELEDRRLSGCRFFIYKQAVKNNWPKAMEKPDLFFGEDGTPESKRFGDTYFSRAGGLEETRHVFLKGIGAPEVWQDRSQYVIGETGFGTGLNFLVTWDMWRKTAPPDARLHFVSVEGWPEFQAMAEELRKQLPPRHEGFHHLSFDDGRVQLTLLYGDVVACLRELEAAMDGWFLDGFAPSRNQAMWSEEVISEIARCSRPGTRLATYTVAGFVRRGLEEAGFDLTRAEGFGRKRECLTGEYQGGEVKDVSAPWFACPEPEDVKSVAIVGAGIAGLSAAHALKRNGVKVTVFEQAEGLGAGGSGNPVGALDPRVGLGGDGINEFHHSAFVHAVPFYEALEAKGCEVWASERGLLQLAKNERDTERFQKIAESSLLPDGWCCLLDNEAAQEVVNMDVTDGGLFFPKAGSIFVQNVLMALARDQEIVFNTVVSAVETSDEKVSLTAAHGRELGAFDAVVWALGGETPARTELAGLEITPKRGQLSLLGAVEGSEALARAISGPGYLTPAVVMEHGATHIGGATFQHWQDPADRRWADLADEDHTEVRVKLSGIFAENWIADAPLYGGRASLRATTPDRTPHCGPLPNRDFYLVSYAGLQKGHRHVDWPKARYLPRQFTLTGLGSRGLLTAPILAEVMAAYITGAPQPLPRAQLQVVHPARLLVRALKRNQVRPNGSSQ